MGNQLVSSVKTVIRPIDFYLAEVADIRYKQSLGQTQFLKVALCDLPDDGEVVVKVLAHEDPSLLLDQYVADLLKVARLTTGNFSLATFRIVETKNNFAYMVRQYIRYSLYDRLSTRPFLAPIEKAWIVYQICRCLAWCHERRLYHGDLKLENILITSNLWVVIGDLATYKPVMLPNDNPSIFNFFFDTSRRRCCNIAPERFVPAHLAQLDNVGVVIESTPAAGNTSSSSSASSPSSSPVHGERNLNGAMDMFSLGCIMAEIFADTVLFDLSGLLQYKESKRRDRIESVLKLISNEDVRQLISRLTSLEPAERMSATDVLVQYRGRLFPTYFDQLYELMWKMNNKSCDARITYLIDEVDTYLPAMLANEDPSGLLIILMLATSSMRSLDHVHVRLGVQRLIVALVQAADGQLSSYVTDRLVPYIAYALRDSNHRVRAKAIQSLTILLESVKRLEISDNNIFTDYLLEIFTKHLNEEKYAYVRITMAQHVGRLSKVALAFLNQSCDHNYDEELKILHQYFQNLVAQLLTDPINCVRLALLFTPENCAQLCTFFGRQKTNEIILSHIITFLNDKNDFRLRLSFFDNIIIIASYLGVQCSPILFPLLQQGLCDAEEIIIAKTISCIGVLVEQGLLHKNNIYEIIKEVLPFLHHPNQWITNSIVHLITILANQLSIVDFNCKVAPLLSPYLASSITAYKNSYLLLGSLQRPITRDVYDSVFVAKDRKMLEAFFERLKNPAKQIVLNNIYTRLVNDTTNRAKILRLQNAILKIDRNKRNLAANNNGSNRGEPSNSSDDWNLDELVQHPGGFTFGRDIKCRCNRWLENSSEVLISMSANHEWQQMFGLSVKSIQNGPVGADISLLTSELLMDASQKDETKEGTSGSKHEKEIDKMCQTCPPCALDVRRMLLHKKKTSTSPMSTFGGGGFTSVHQSHTLKPAGVLVAQIYEHKSAVNQMAAYKSSHFLTASDDGLIKLWDVGGIESRVMLRSKYTVDGRANFRGIVNCGDNLITWTSKSLHVFEVVRSSISFLCSFNVGAFKTNVPLQITSVAVLSDNVFAVSLSDSVMYGYDVRLFNTDNFFIPVFKLTLGPEHRTVTALNGNELMLCAGTANGYIAAFDLRFNLECNYFQHGHNQRVVALKFCSEGLYSSIHEKARVTLWNYKMASDKANKTSNINRILSCFSSKSAKTPTIYTMLPGASPTSLLTGGSDMRIRYWDLNNPNECYLVSDPSFKTCNYCLEKPCTLRYPIPAPVTGNSSTITGKPSISNFGGPGGSNTSWNRSSELVYYRTRTEDDIQMIEEKINEHPVQISESAHGVENGLQHIVTGHKDTITDLLQVDRFLISSGRSGTVKIWR